MFRQQEERSFINITSTAGLIGNIGQANYGAAKAGYSGTVAHHGDRHEEVQRAIELHRALRVHAHVESIPIDRPEMAAKVEKARRMESRKIAPMAVYLASDLSEKVTGQVFCVRANEIFLLSQPRPLRSVHRSDGWTVHDIAQHAIPAMQSDFYGLDVSADVFSWDPI